MSERPPFWGSSASYVLVLWIHFTACLLLVTADEERGVLSSTGWIGWLMVFSSPLGLIGWRFYGWQLMGAMASVGFTLLMMFAMVLAFG